MKGLIYFLLFVGYVPTLFFLLYVIWYKTDSLAIKVKWFVINLLPFGWVFFIRIANKPRLKKWRKFGFITSTGIILLALLISIGTIFFAMFEGAHGLYKQQLDQPFKEEENLWINPDSLKYWGFIHKQPRKNIIYQHEDWSMDLYYYEIVTYRNTKLNLLNGTPFSKCLNNEIETGMLLVADNFGNTFSKQDTLRLPLNDGICYKNTFNYYPDSSYSSYLEVTEKLLWDKQLRLMYYYVSLIEYN
jgi:amino acid transporter